VLARGVTVAFATISAEFAFNIGAIVRFGKRDDAPDNERKNADRDSNRIHYNGPNEVVIGSELTRFSDVAIMIFELWVVKTRESGVLFMLVHLVLRSVAWAIPYVIFAIITAGY